MAQLTLCDNIGVGSLDIQSQTIQGRLSTHRNALARLLHLGAGILSDLVDLSAKFAHNISPGIEHLRNAFPGLAHDLASLID